VLLLLGFCFWLAGNDTARADGMRCGTRLVVTGDPVSRLLKACGEPRSRTQSRVDIGNRGNTREVPVRQWIYGRAGRADLIVSVHNGRVVKIERG